MSEDSYSAISQQWANKRNSRKHYAHDFLEKPAFFGEIGDVQGKTILNLGCGSGEECWFHINHGAALVHGIDISKSLIEHAKYLELPNKNISFEVGDIGNMTFERNMPFGGYDFVVSSLTFHYIENWNSMLSNIKRVLKPGGRLVLSTHHPVKWGSQTKRTPDGNSFILGYSKSKSNSTIEVFGDYLGFRAINDILFGQMKVTYYNRSISRIFSELTEAGLVVTNILEPSPDITSTQTPEDFREIYSKIPLFVIFSAISK